MENPRVDELQKIAVIVPTYNEKENIARLLSEIFIVAPRVSVFVVDDNSPDGTATLVNSLLGKFSNLRLINRQKKEGLGKAYLFVFNEILKNHDFETIITMDADFSHNPAYLPKMIELRRDFDLVIGSRYVAGGRTIGWETWRRGLSYFANLYCRLILRTPVRDNTSGFLAVKAALLRQIDFSQLDFSGYAFTVGLKYLLLKQHATFTELPIVFKNRVGGESKISNHIIKEGIASPWKMIRKK
ncbi:MAG: polyprenol monophosphomannose synthase [Candidatus Komeilibacteria bacterium]|nr:polyprenol monophosphomannose synthase [Candidatus Komeilibacteria bacterium]